jgi:ankyrin repeat protein
MIGYLPILDMAMDTLQRWKQDTLNKFKIDLDSIQLEKLFHGTKANNFEMFYAQLRTSIFNRALEAQERPGVVNPVMTRALTGLLLTGGSQASVDTSQPCQICEYGVHNEPLLRQYAIEGNFGSEYSARLRRILLHQRIHGNAEASTDTLQAEAGRIAEISSQMKGAFLQAILDLGLERHVPASLAQSPFFVPNHCPVGATLPGYQLDCLAATPFHRESINDVQWLLRWRSWLTDAYHWNVTDVLGRSTLHLLLGNDAFIEWRPTLFHDTSLDTRFDYTGVTDLNHTALHYAATCANSNSTELYEALISYGIDINATDKLGSTALFYAVKARNSILVEFLIAQRDIDLDKAEGTVQPTPLCQAVLQGKLSYVQLFLDAGADPNVSGLWQKQRLPLTHIALESRDIDILRLLSDHPNINMNQKDEDSFTPLELAVIHGFDEEFSHLTAHPKVDVNCGALHSAVTHGNLQMLKTLVDHSSIDINAKDENSSTALVEACLKLKPDAVEILLGHPNVDLNLQGSLGRSALMCVFEGDLEDRREAREQILGLLLRQQKPPDVNKRNVSGQTILFDVATRDKTGSLISLLSAQRYVDVNIKDNTMKTALVLAIISGNNASTQVLLQRSDIKLRLSSAPFGPTVAEFARRLGKEEIANMIDKREQQLLLEALDSEPVGSLEQVIFDANASLGLPPAYPYP